jgi:hypothetical protein
VGGAKIAEIDICVFQRSAKMGEVNIGIFGKEVFFLLCRRGRPSGPIVVHAGGHTEASRRGTPLPRTMLEAQYNISAQHHLVAPFATIVIYRPKRGNKGPRGAEQRKLPLRRGDYAHTAGKVRDLPRTPCPPTGALFLRLPILSACSGRCRKSNSHAAKAA